MKLRPRFFMYTAAVIASALVITGCSQGAPERDAANARQAAEEQILLVGNGAEPESLDPHIVTGIPEHHVLTALYEGLVRLDPATLEAAPGVAESWEVSEDGKTYTFHLREDARWSNGDPVTAADFLYGWKRILTPALASEYAYMLFYMENAEAYNRGEISDFSQVGCEAPDPRTVIVRLNDPTPFFLQLHQHYSWFPVHRATIEKFGDIGQRNTGWSRPENSVTNGPFMLTRWEPNNVIETRKNPEYWDTGRVRLNGVNFYPVTSEQTEERMFRSGQLHITENVPLAKVQIYKNKAPELIRTDPWNGSYFYRINTQRKPFDDPRVRMALALALDRKAVCTSIVRDGSTPAPFLTPPNLKGYTSEAEIPYDPERARALLAEAGYPNGEGFPSFEILYNTLEKHKIVATAVQQMWKRELGIDVRLINQDWKVYLANTANETMNYDVARAGWIGDFVDPINFLECFTTGNGNNRTGWSNEEYDRLIAQARLSNDQAERHALYQQAEAILLEGVPIVPIFHYTRAILMAPEIKNFKPNVLSYVPYDTLWLDVNGVDT